MPRFQTKALDPSTWPDFAALAERHGGVFGGCWCMSFHAEGVGRTSAEQNRNTKEVRVREGRAHAALLYDGDSCVGWCQFGPPDELPRIKLRRAYEEGSPAAPDWRITCFFVDQKHRRGGVAAAALAGALELIAQLDGGTVESYPQETDGRKTLAGRFLYNLTLDVFESQGFERVRRLGKNHWVVTRVVT